MTAHLEHADLTVCDLKATAAWMENLFGWHVRWQGAALAGGYTVHVGTAQQYLAIYAPEGGSKAAAEPPFRTGSLNHIGVVVDDLDASEKAINAHGFETGNHQDYEPGRRFYFHDDDGIEYEVVQYDRPRA